MCCIRGAGNAPGERGRCLFGKGLGCFPSGCLQLNLAPLRTPTFALGTMHCSPPYFPRHARSTNHPPGRMHEKQSPPTRLGWLKAYVCSNFSLTAVHGCKACGGVARWAPERPGGRGGKGSEEARKGWYTGCSPGEGVDKMASCARHLVHPLPWRAERATARRSAAGCGAKQHHPPWI